MHGLGESGDVERMPMSDWKLVVVNPAFTDQAWRDGAVSLSEACKRSAGECDPGQLKMRISRGELGLLMATDGNNKAWAAVEISQTPNLRLLHVYAIYAPGLTFACVFDLLKDYARGNGCSAIQGACDEAIARLWVRRFRFKEAYRIMRYDL